MCLAERKDVGNIPLDFIFPKTFSVFLPIAFETSGKEQLYIKINVLFPDFFHTHTSNDTMGSGMVEQFQNASYLLI